MDPISMAALILCDFGLFQYRYQGEPQRRDQIAASQSICPFSYHTIVLDARCAFNIYPGLRLRHVRARLAGVKSCNVGYPRGARIWNAWSPA